jgi:DNA polymerase-3 subunit epsilon
MASHSSLFPGQGFWPSLVLETCSMIAFQYLRLCRPLVFLDAESTGVQPHIDRLIELGLCKVWPHAAAERYVVRFHPGIPIPPASTAVHGLRDADVAGYPPFAQHAGSLASWLAGCDLGGFGIKRFDLPLLVAEFARAGVSFDLRGRAVLDPLQVFHQREARDLTAALRFYCGVQHPHAHQASADAFGSAMVLDAQLGRYRDLPATPAELHALFTEVDIGGQFARAGDQIVFAFGKHKGQPLPEVARNDPGYLQWMLSQPFLADTLDWVHWALQLVANVNGTAKA